MNHFSPWCPRNPLVVLWVLYAALLWVPVGFLAGRNAAPDIVVQDCPEPDTLYIQTSYDEYGEPYQELVTDLEINKYPMAVPNQEGAE